MSDVVILGPLADGRAQAALDLYAHEVVQKVAGQGQQMVRDHLNTVIRQNHGVYVSRVNVRDVGADAARIENDMVYSPWLEGTSQRNRSTRFKGYHTFRLVRQQLDAKAEAMAEEILRPYLARMQ